MGCHVWMWRACALAVVAGLGTARADTAAAGPRGGFSPVHSDQAPQTQKNWAGISCYYLYACNSTIRSEALNAVRAAGLKVVRVFLLSTEGGGAVSACADTPTPDLEPTTVGAFNDAILERLDNFLFDASQRGIKVTLALHDRWSLGCWRSDAYQRKYNLTQTNCAKSPGLNDPSNFYLNGRDDFKRRIAHVLSFPSKHAGVPLGQWHDALFSVEPENEAFGHSGIAPANKGWMCEMAAAVRANLHPAIAVTTGGGGVGNASGPVELARVASMAACPSIDVIAMHSYDAPAAIGLKLAGYAAAVGSKRLMLQEWGATGANSTAQAVAFAATAAIAAKHRVPQMFWGLQPAHDPQPSTTLAVSPPAPAPSPGAQRHRGPNGAWVNKCTDTSCPTEVWVTALYPAAQSAALQVAASDWPEVWGCASAADCQHNGACVGGACRCLPGWRGPTCAALRLSPAPRDGGFRHANLSSWGGSIVRDNNGTYHMFSSLITEGCGLNAWSTNSEIVRATATNPAGPYRQREVVAERFAHEPNLVYGTPNGSVILLATMYPDPPTGFANCTSNPPPGPSLTTPMSTAAPPPPGPPRRNTYVWAASSPEGIASAPRQLAIDALKWNHDILHNGAICDTNAAAAVLPADGSSAGGVGVGPRVVGLWRHCETAHLHTVPHTFVASDGADGATYQPNTSVNVPFMSHAGAEDPMVWTTLMADGTGRTVLHALLHDEQITRCADAPVGCWPGGRHAFSVDGGNSWAYSPLDAYNGTVEFDDGTTEDFYLRARPHLLLDDSGHPVALSNGLRPTKASDYVFTLVQPVSAG